MKLGFASFVSAAIAVSAAVGVAADCPDFTSYAQVCSPFLAMRTRRVGDASRGVVTRRADGSMVGLVETARQPFVWTFGFAVHAALP